MKKILLFLLTVLAGIIGIFSFLFAQDGKTYLVTKVYEHPRCLYEDGKIYLDLTFSGKFDGLSGDPYYCIENAYPVGSIEGLTFSTEKKHLFSGQTSLTCVLQNNTDKTYYASRPVLLERRIGGVWFILNGWEAAFFSDAVYFPADSSTECSVDLRFAQHGGRYKTDYKPDRGRYRATIEVRSEEGIAGYLSYEFNVW